jgi:hypothetical protein
LIISASYAKADKASQNINTNPNPKSPAPIVVTSQYQPLCSSPQTREDAEYCQEWGATKATEEQAKWAFYQLVASVIGIGAVIATLIYTAKSVRASERGAKAAEDGVKHARTIAEQESRPWIILESVVVSWRPEHNKIRIKNNWWVSFVFKNIGKVPAEIIACEICIVDKDGLPESPVYDGALPLTVKAIFAVEDSSETNKIGTKPGSEGDKVVFGRIVYRGLNGREGTTGFSVAIAPMFPASSTFPGEKYSYYK